MNGCGAVSDAELDAAIRAILGRYTVAQHYLASSRVGPRKYAVWIKGNGGIPGSAEQVIEPTSHREAHEARTGLIAADILELVRGEVAA